MRTKITIAIGALAISVSAALRASRDSHPFQTYRTANEKTSACATRR